MLDSSSDWGDVPSWIALIFSLTSLVWQAISALFAKSERKAFQQKVRIEQLISDVDELRAQAIAYWMKPGDASAAEGLLIVSKVKDISARAGAYKDFLWDGVQLDFARVKTKITGGNFQVKTRAALKADAPFVRDFVEESAAFRERLRQVHDEIDTVA